MTRPVFADTSFYVALVNPRDLAHAKAMQIGERIRGPVWLTDFILLELGNVLSRPGQRDLFARMVERLRSDANVRIIPASRELLDRGLGLFCRRADKAWSLTDCISFTIMKEGRLADALTTDFHFEQAGFTALLR